MKRGFEHLNCAITSRTRRDVVCYKRLCSRLGEMRPSYASLCSVYAYLFLLLLFFGKRDKHSCSASAIINLPMGSICWQFVVNASRISQSYFPWVWLRDQSLFFLHRAVTLVSRVSRLGRSTLARACTPLTRLNLKKTRGCLQSTADPCSLPGISNFAITVFWSTSRHSFYYSMRNAYSDLIENKMGAVFPRIIAGGDYFFFRTKRGRLFEGGDYFKQCSLERSCPKYFVLLCH